MQSELPPSEEGRNTSLEYVDGGYVLIEHESSDGEENPYPCQIVCKKDTAGEIIDFVVDNYGEEDTINVSEIMAMILEMESQERMLDIRSTLSKVSNNTMQNIIKYILDSFGITGSIDSLENDEDFS